MAYDDELAERIRELIEPDPQLSEKKMFGGLAFLIGGNMAVAASAKGGLLVRVDPEDADALLDRAGVQTAVMGGRAMTGWLRVEAARLADDAALREWVERGTGYARTLPAKPPQKRRPPRFDR